MSRFPLTLMEEYLLAEDKPAYPCWIFLRLRFRGAMEETKLRAAWRSVVRRHPTLHSRVVRDRRGRPHWESMPEDHEPVFIWQRNAGASPALAWTRLDLSRAPAVRLVVAAAEEHIDVSLEGHHAIFDGIGVFAVAHDILLTYARALGSAVEPPAWRPERFPQRNRFGLGWWDRVKLAPVQLLGLWFAWQMQRRGPAPLIPHALSDFSAAPPDDFPHVLHHTLDAADLARLRAVARHHEVSLNDVLIRDLQAAIGAWRSGEGVGRPEDWIVIAIPVSLRRAADRLLPAANVIGIVAIDRRAKSLANRPRLLRRAREDMDLVKRHQLGYTFLVLLGWLRALGGGIARYCNRPHCRATAVLTNLGQPFSRSPLLDATKRLQLPGAVLEDYTMAAPCRPRMVASVAVAIYAGRLLIDLHYDPRALPRAQAERFVAHVLEQLRATRTEGPEIAR